MFRLEIWLEFVWYNLFFNFLKMLFQKIVPREKWGFEKLEKNAILDFSPRWELINLIILDLLHLHKVSQLRIYKL